ncbi:transposase [Archangium violaceum]|uniref:transposase n=1 Tax=Archangium violaceum TaxID=83451 RepID=UPI003D2D8E9E
MRHASGRNEPAFDARSALYTLLGADLSQIHGFGPYTVLRLIAECGDDMRKWPTAKHFTSWLCLAPSNKISGGRLLSSRTRRSSNRAATLLRIAAVSIGRTQTALGPSTGAWRCVPGRPRLSRPLPRLNSKGGPSSSTYSSKPDASKARFFIQDGLPGARTAQRGHRFIAHLRPSPRAA